MEFDDFINIETTNLKGKTIIKVDDTYIDSFDGQEIDYTSPIHSDDGSGWEGEDSQDLEEGEPKVVSKTVTDICDDKGDNDKGNNNGDNGDDNGDNEIYVSNRKPDMVVMEDNEIMARIKRTIIENKHLYCGNIGNIPLLISMINNLLDDGDLQFQIDLKFDYVQHVLEWMNMHFYKGLYSVERPNMINVVYRNIMMEYEKLKLAPILPYNEQNIYRDQPINMDKFIENMLRNDNMYFIHNVFELIVELMKMVNKFNLNKFQKKLYVMHVIKLMSERDIFSDELECIKMKKAHYLYASFIDTILENNQIIIDGYRAENGCIESLKSLFCMIKHY